MIAMEDAVQSAFSAFQRLYLGADAKDPLLEEIEPAGDGKDWIVTIGFNTSETETATALDAILAKSRGMETPIERKKHWRKYKSFLIDSEDGRVKSMKTKES